MTVENTKHVSTQPRITLLTSNLSTRAGGLYLSVPSTAASLAKHDLDISLVGLRDDLYNRSALPNIPVHAVAQFPTPALSVAPALNRVLQRIDPQILHLQGLWLYPSISAGRHLRRSGCKLVISPHGMLDAWALRQSAWKKRLAMLLFERRNLARASLIHALTTAERDSVRSLGIDTPVAVVPNGVDLPDLDLHDSPPDWMRGDRRRVLLFLGRLHPKKGLAESLRGWACVQRRRPRIARDWVFVIAGWDDGGYRHELQRLAAELGLAETVRFVGPVFGRNKARLLRSSSAFLLASHSEGLPVAVLEAWACRIPVIMSERCNLPEGFAVGAAIKIQPNPANIAATLESALDAPQLSSIGLAGRRLVASRFSWERVAADLHHCYRWTLGRAEPPPFLDFSAGSRFHP